MNYEMIAAYLAGELTGEEKKKVEYWMNISEENGHNFRRWQLLWKASQREANNFDIDIESAWQKVNPEKAVPTETVLRVNKSAKLLYWAKRMAAILVLALTLGWAAIQAVNHIQEPSLTWIEKVTRKNVKTEMLLPDGTKVWLNEESKLRYPEEFGPDSREAYLEGEAYLEVSHDPDKPFLIYTGQTRTEVLGTSFNIRGYEADSTIEVTLLTGKVAFSSTAHTKEDKVVLAPQQKAVYHKVAQSINIINNKDPNLLAWKTGELIFKNTPLRMALPILESYYHVTFKATDLSLLNCEFTGSFTQASLQEVLDVFAYGRDITYTKKGNTYLLSGEGCQ